MAQTLHQRNRQGSRLAVMTSLITSGSDVQVAREAYRAMVAPMELGVPYDLYGTQFYVLN